MTEREWLVLPWETNKRIKRTRGIPGAGKGGMVQLASAGNVSMLVKAPYPPLMINPVMVKVHKTLN